MTGPHFLITVTIIVTISDDEASLRALSYGL
jgi:hypothetical protein